MAPVMVEIVKRIGAILGAELVVESWNRSADGWRSGTDSGSRWSVVAIGCWA